MTSHLHNFLRVSQPSCTRPVIFLDFPPKYRLIYGGTCADNEAREVAPRFRSVGREPSGNSSCIRISVHATHARGFGKHYQRLTEIASDLRKKKRNTSVLQNASIIIKLMETPKDGWKLWKLRSDKLAE